VTDLFPGFEQLRVPTARGEVNAVVGGSGPPLLLLHGYPQSLLMWHGVAPLLAAHHTVVATDLSGYGMSFRPAAEPDHRPHSKRAMARDQVEVMTALGFDSFALAGHDRGGRVAYRLALDHPGRVERLAVLDIVPTAEVWARGEAELARIYWHWSFLSLPAPLSERLIGGDPDAFFVHHACEQLGLGKEAGRYPAAVLDAYRRALTDPGAVEAMCEDYRAGATVDVEDDEADRRTGRKIECPVLVLWAARGALPRLYPDVLEVWGDWADDLSGTAIDATHFLAEDRPAETAERLAAFAAAEVRGGGHPTGGDEAG
jgi:haloacetate dehalogenase